MFTIRQSKLLAYLMNDKDWVKTRELSAFLEVSNKTVLKEIHLVNEVNPEELHIGYVRNKGFRFNHLSEEMKSHIIKSDFEKENFHTLKDNPTVFILYLLFKGTSISLQHLSDTFYMSKTAVAKEFQIVKRWISRAKGLELEKNRFGFRIIGEEKFKRLYISNIINGESLRELDLVDYSESDYQKYFRLVTKELSVMFIKNHVFLSDLDFNRLCKYVVVSIMRSKENHPLEQVTKAKFTYKIVKEFSINISTETNYSLTDIELQEIEKLIDLFSWESSLYPIEAVNKVVEKQVSTMMKQLNYHSTIDKESIRTISQTLLLLKKKQEEGITTLNLLNDEIIMKHLFSSYHAYQILSELNIPIDKELSRIVLLLQLCVEKQAEKMKILLISKSNKEVIKNIKYQLELCSNEIEVTYYPKYVIESQSFSFKQYDLLLTTEEEIVVEYPRFKFIEAIPDKTSILSLYLREEKRIGQKLETQKELQFKQIQIAEKDKTDDFLSKAEHFDVTNSSVFLLKGSEIIIVTIDQYSENEVVEINFAKSVLIKNLQIKKIHYITCNKNNTSMKDFFETVSLCLG